ncbi:molybdopterin-guanine dinucleotide biosynthesis protein B [Clostridium sp.]|uniref:molybdopterin-guanine dinucleotide biosynthesis protein B n=1 Tax=Clostridium sp. TaxID=1506 RepID=UPI003991BC55
MKSEITAVILSGGKNSRMNYKTKAFLDIDGKSFIEKRIEELQGFKEIIISCNDFDLYSKFTNKCRLVADVKKEIGPIGAIYSVFKETDAEKIFVIAADMPEINPDIVENMSNIEFAEDALVVSFNGRIEPLLAIYKRSTLDKLEELIMNKSYKLLDFINGIKSSYFYVSDKESLLNINTLEDYNNFLRSRKKLKKPTVINIVAGCSNSGKTTLIEGILKALKKKDYVVSTIKHDVHGFDIDKEGKDTYRHRIAGADNVAISSANRFALIRELKEEIPLEDVIKTMPQSDFIIVEGFKNSNYRKIEVFRKGFSKNIITQKEQLIAVATDQENLKVDGIVVDLNDYDAIVKLIEEEAGLCTL